MKDEVTIKGLLKYVLNRRGLVAVLTLAGLILSFGYYLYNADKRKVTLTIRTIDSGFFGYVLFSKTILPVMQKPGVTISLVKVSKLLPADGKVINFREVGLISIKGERDGVQESYKIFKREFMRYYFLRNIQRHLNAINRYLDEQNKIKKKIQFFKSKEKFLKLKDFRNYPVKYLGHFLNVPEIMLPPDLQESGLRLRIAWNKDKIKLIENMIKEEMRIIEEYRKYISKISEDSFVEKFCLKEFESLIPYEEIYKFCSMLQTLETNNEIKEEKIVGMKIIIAGGIAGLLVGMFLAMFIGILRGSEGD